MTQTTTIDDTLNETNPHADNYHRFHELRADPGTYEFTTDCVPGLRIRSRDPAALGRHVAKRFHFTTIFGIPSAPHEAYITTYAQPDDREHRRPSAAAEKFFFDAYFDVKFA